VAVVWRTLDLASPTHLLPSVQGGYTPIHLSTTAERTWQERSLSCRQQALVRVREALPAEDFAALEAAAHARLVVEGTPMCVLGLAVRVAVDEAHEARVGLPSFAVWQQTPKVC
jgi:hypothetical protein